MLKEKYVKVILTDEERDALFESAQILDELADAMGSVISTSRYYDIDLEDLRDTIKAIAYERIFEINEQEGE